MTTNTATTTESDLLGMRVAHRAMRRDANRLAQLADRIAHRPAALTPARSRAIADYIELYARSIEHHHGVEDDVLWPIIVASAGMHVDLTELTDDHHALGPILEELRSSSRALPDPDAADLLARTLAQLRDLLDEHIDDEERTVFPLVTAYVSAGQWAIVEKAAQKGGRFDFDVTRAFATLTDDERRTTPLPLALRVMLAMTARKQRARERAVFGKS